MHGAKLFPSFSGPPWDKNAGSSSGRKWIPNQHRGRPRCSRERGNRSPCDTSADGGEVRQQVRGRVSGTWRRVMFKAREERRGRGEEGRGGVSIEDEASSPKE